MSWRSLQAQGLTRPFVLTYWPSWLIYRPEWPYTSCFISRKRQEKHWEMHWLTQNHFWHICQKSLGVTLSPLALNVIMYNQKYLLLLSQLKICFSRIINMIDLCYTPDTSVRHALKGYRLTRGLHSTSSPKDSSTSLAYHCIACLQPLQQYTKRKTWFAAQFHTKRETCKLLWLHPQGVGVRYTYTASNGSTWR